MTGTLKEREVQLRLDGEELDRLWMAARNASGRARTDLHNQIGPMREKLTADRKEQQELRESQKLSNQNKA